jgi:hypothetical protein
MKLAQVTLVVPDDIYANVIEGILEIEGLVKDNKHIIRKHLPRVADAVPKNSAAQKVKKIKIMQVVKNNKVMAIGIGIAAAAGGGIAYVIHSIKARKTEQLEECVTGFRKSLKAYLKATKDGKINAKVVDDLLEALKEIEKCKAGENVMLEIPASQLNELINGIFDYTKRLAEANTLEIKLDDPKRGTKNSISNLQSYLEIQKQIIINAA